MRIKRFIAPDMRTALRMVRDEQGPDAVILSNRPTADGIEVVAATDYDEALVQQALRAAAPGLADIAVVAMPAEAVAPAPTKPIARPAPAPIAVAAGVGRNADPSRAEAMIAALATTSPRDTVAARARAMFRVGERAQTPALDGIDADQLVAAAHATHTPPATRQNAVESVIDTAPSPAAPPALSSLLNARAADHVAAPVVQADTASPGDDFRAMLAKLTADHDAETAELRALLAEQTPAPVAPAVVETAPVAAAPMPQSADVIEPTPAPVAAAPIAPAAPVAVAPIAVAAPALTPAALTTFAPANDALVDVPAAIADATVVAAAIETPIASSVVSDTATVESEPVADTWDTTREPVRPALVAVATQVEDPALVAMRAELSRMRELIERQRDQYAIDRLRGSAGRASVFDALVGYGCDEGVAQSIASRIDARLTPEEAREPMFAELSRMIVCNRAEPIDDGGVIALVGPTGAGKTTTAAKLAARFAARHRTRDVALVTTDIERAGAREQLHAHGRRLGITVCEAQGPEALNETLAQLADYPLVLVDTAGYAARDRALLSQILWLRTARRMRSLLVLPANANPHDMSEMIRRYRPASPEGVVLTKTDETGRLGTALSVLVKQDLSLAYTASGQNVTDLDVANPARLVQSLEKLRRAADNPLHTEDRHAVA